MTVVSFSVLVGYVAKYQWIYEENVAYNMFVMMRPYTFPSVLNVFEKSIEEQIEHFQKLTSTMEQQSQSQFVAKFYGKEYYDASFGPNQTQVISLFATRTPTTTSTTRRRNGDDNYSVPIKCTCPYRRDYSSSSSSSSSSEDDDDEEKNKISTKLPLVLYYHGGGLVMGSIDGELVWTRWLAQTANAVVCSVGYRKVPQYTYPIPINDAIYASRSILLLHRKPRLTHSIEEELGVSIDYNRVATWGMSAGGYLAGHVVRRILFDIDDDEEEKDNGKEEEEGGKDNGVRFQCQFSLIPMVTPFAGTSSLIRYWNRMYSGYEYIYAWSKYLQSQPSPPPPPPPNVDDEYDSRNNDDDEQRQENGTPRPLVSNWKVSLLVDPPFVSQHTLKEKLPPTYIQIATQDILRDEGEMYVTLSVIFCAHLSVITGLVPPRVCLCLCLGAIACACSLIIKCHCNFSLLRTLLLTYYFAGTRNGYNNSGNLSRYENTIQNMLVCYLVYPMVALLMDH